MRFQRLEDLRIDADKTQEEIANILDCTFEANFVLNDTKEKF